MGAAAVALPEKLVASASEHALSLDPVLVAGFRLEWSELVDHVRQARPAEGSPAEDDALRRMAALAARAMKLFGAGFAAIYRDAINAAIKEILDLELSTSETARKLAIRQIEQAAHRYGVVFESLGAALDELSDDDLAALYDAALAEAEAGQLPLSEHDRVIIRFQLDFAVAVESLAAPLEELTYWAFRAVTGARRVEALGAVIATGVRGDVARVRSKRSWLRWDEAELQKELAPWPPIARRP